MLAKRRKVNFSYVPSKIENGEKVNRIYLPVDICFGEKVLNTNGDAICGLGQKPMLVTGKKSAITSGALDDVVSLLKSSDKEYFIFNEITENPDLDTIDRAINLFVENKCDYAIGIGGGSPLDASKAIALGAANRLRAKDLYDVANHHQCYPIIAVPTTSGTGSEVTQYSVLSDNEAKKKAGFTSFLVFPIVAYIDPQYTLSVPPIVTRDTAIDALSHLLEGLYSNTRNRLLFPFIYEGIKLIVHNLKDLLGDLRNLDLREKMMRASLYGGIAIAHSGTTLQHAIGYPLTSELGLSHGMANGVAMKAIMELFYPSVKEGLDEMFRQLNMSKEEFYDWLDSLDLIYDGQITEEFIEAKYDEVMQSRNMGNNPFEVNAEQVKEVYRKIGR